MGFRDKIRKKFRATLAALPRRERPSSVSPSPKQGPDGTPSPNLASPQDGSLHRAGSPMAPGDREPNATTPIVISPKGSGELGVGAIEPSSPCPASATNAPSVVISVTGDVSSLSSTGGTSALEQSALTGEPPLWRQAFDELSEDDKEVFQSAGAREPGIVDDVVRMAEESKAACQQNQRKFKFRGKDIIVRDVAYKLLGWVDKFKAVGDIAIQYDPVHAALPWAGVRFLLQIAVNQKESMEAVLVGLEQVVIPLVRCAIYEKLYLSSTLSIAVQLKIVLKELYLAILKFLAYAKRYFEKSTTRQMYEGLLESEGKSLFDEVERQDSRIQREVVAADMEPETTRLKEILSSLNEPIIRVDQSVTRMYEKLHSIDEVKKRDEILRWLCQVEYEKHHKQAKSELLVNTGKWLQEAKEFRDWRSSSASGILWLRGLVGTGKTKLVCRVIEILRTAERGDEPVVYFYFNRNDPQRQDPTALLQAIVKQLSIAFPGLPKLVLAEYKKRQDRGHAEGPLDWEECRDLIVNLLGIYPQTTVVIDALDECEMDKRWILFDALQAMTGSSGLVKIFVSSRDETDIRRGLEQIPYLFVDAQKNTVDISNFVRRDVTESLRKGRFQATVSEKLKEKIISTIAGQANGMFQWAALQIYQLYTIRLTVDIERTLGKLPATLEQTYDQIWKAIRDAGLLAYQLTEMALMWISCSMRPLNMEEWVEASYLLADFPSDDKSPATLLDLCRNLVMWDSELGRVIFAHLSVQEYLEAKVFNSVKAHSMAAQSCLSCLTYPKYPLKDRTWLSSVKERTFKSYAFMWWGYHFERAFNREQGMSDQAREQLLSFLGTSTNPSEYYCKWLENVAVFCAGFESGSRLNTEYYYLRSIPPNPLFAMSFYKFGGELEKRWELEVVNTDCKNYAQEPLLHVAIARGNQWAVEYLCSKGADVNTIINRRSLLMLAIDLDRGVELCSLLDRGAKIAAPDGVYSTLLHAAASRGGARVVEAILARGADISEAVILAAAENRQHGAKIMKLLLTRDTKIKITQAVVMAAFANQESGPGLMELFDRSSLQVPDEALVAALSRDDFEVVEVVLDRSPDISERVLVAVAAGELWGIKCIRGLLLTSGAKLQITPAVAAAVMENWACGPELMKLLFDREPSLQVPEAAVIAGLGKGNIEAVEVVLDRSPGVSEAVLMAVAKRPGGPELIRKLLLTSDAQLQITGAVVAAVVENWESGPKLMELLFSRESFLHVPDATVVEAVESTHGLLLIEPLLARGSIPVTESLLIAASSVQDYDPKLVRLLLAGGRDIKVTEAVLAAAVSNGWNDEDIIAQLLARDPDLRITEATLAVAAASRPAKTVNPLLARYPETTINEATLMAAASNRLSSAAIVELLLARYRDIKITEAVWTAAVSNETSGVGIVELLLARGPEIEITGAILTAAAANRNCGLEVLELLLPRYPNIKITEVVLIAAASNSGCGKEIVQLLLAQCSDIKITVAVMAAATVCEKNLKEIIRMLSAGGHSFEVDFALVMAAADLDWDEELLRILLARYPNTTTSESELLVAAKSKRHPELIVGFLLDRDATLSITEAIVIAALEHEYCRVGLVEMLLDRGAELRISEAIAVAAAQCLRRPGGWGIIELLLERNGIIELPGGIMIHAERGNPDKGLLPLLLTVDSKTKITSALLVEAAKSGRDSKTLMQVLLAAGDATNITEEVLVAAAANETKRREGPGAAVALVELLLTRNPSLQITEAVMVAAARSSRAVEVLRYLWIRDSSLRVTEAVVVAAAANASCGPEVIRLLLTRDDGLEITERVMIAAAANSGCGPQVIEVLLTRDATIKVTERILMASVASTQGPDIMALLFAYDATVEITGALVMAVARSGNGKAMARLLDRNPNIECTDVIVKAATEKRHPLGDIMPRYWGRDSTPDILQAFRRRDVARDTGAPPIQL